MPQADTVLTAFELNQQLVAKATEVEKALTELRFAGKNWADCDRDLKMAQSQEYAKGVSGKNETERKAAVYALTAGQDYAQQMAKVRYDIAKEALRAKMAQLSAMQSNAAALREELRLARTSDYAGGN